ncbi:Alpha/beta hydrolase [Candidatus Hodgkinia cicadicola]|nr:Alpha/beta hydrolase [Candidatus Hodgkinia cicadicola]
MQALVRGYKTTLKMSYRRSISNTAPIALCLITKFNKPESEEFNNTLATCLQSLGFSTATLWIKSETARFVTKPTKLQELNLQFALDWLIEKHINSSSKWLVGASLASTLAVNAIIRRPEITNYLLIAPIIDHNNLADVKLLTRLKSAGATIIAGKDAATPASAPLQLISFTKTLEVCTIEFIIIKQADHFFKNKLNNMSAAVAEFYAKTRSHHN